MKVATVLPTPHLDLLKEDDYLLALAHVAMEEPRYAHWFRRERKEGSYLIVDNGAAEIGAGVKLDQLLGYAGAMQANEVVLPDKVMDMRATLEMGEQAIHRIHGRWPYFMMAVPQGSTAEEWAECAREMLTWPIQCLGISRFVVNRGLFRNRTDAILQVVDEIDDLKRDIHLLGCPDDPREALMTFAMLGSRIRGVDSGIAGICAQAGLWMHEGTKKPGLDYDFYRELPIDILVNNVAWWRSRVTGRW